MLPTMRCDPCGKSFTGQVCFQQHVESEKHKKKILNLGHLNSSRETYPQVQSTETTQQTLECPVCKIVFDSLSSFQIHSVSSEHAQKVIEKNSKNNKATEVFNNSNHILNYCDSSNNESIHDGTSDSILPPTEMMVSQTLTFAKCDVCSKTFSGPEPYKQHFESVAHKKKVELEKNGFKMDQNAQFSCSPCKKNFSGHVPYRQHMESENHKKKIVGLQLQEKITSGIDSSLEIKESKAGEINLSNPWFCNICQTPCSGYIPYQQHLEGIPHLKNIAKAKTQNFNSKPVDSEQHSLQNKTIGKDTLDASCMVNGGNIQINNSNRNMDVDYVLPGLEDKFKIMSTEELEKSLKIFLPDEAIDFDKVNKMNTNSSNEEILTSDEMTENPCDYPSCKSCNVDLISKEEAICHFESIEHYSKRWQ